MICIVIYLQNKKHNLGFEPQIVLYYPINLVVRAGKYTTSLSVQMKCPLTPTLQAQQPHFKPNKHF